jgi:L-histidine Nalpha-methyltransferase
VSTFALAPETYSPANPSDALAEAARAGLTASPKYLPAWLFYDQTGSRLFEEITELPEYYVTRTERAIFTAHAAEIIARAAAANSLQPQHPLTLIELGAGTATKTGILLAAAVRWQQGVGYPSPVVYQPVDVSESALAAATENILANVPGVTVRCQVADYTREGLPLDRLRNTRTLALYIGSSIGNFAPLAAIEVLSNLRRQLLPGDMLLLGTDLAPTTENSHKTVADLLAAYDDTAGVTAAFNLNILTHLNRDLGANFDLSNFRHQARWNAAESRIEMHLKSLCPQTVTIPADATAPRLTLHFASHETIHTENSYKFTAPAIAALLTAADFAPTQTWHDPNHLFAVTIATAV